MSLDWTFGRKLGAGFLVTALALVIIAAFGYRSTHLLIENDRWVNHTHQVRAELADLLSFVKDAETNQRGFIITGDEAFVAPYEAALVDIDRSYASVRKLTSDNPDQQRRLDVIKPLIDTRVSTLKTTLEQRRQAGLEVAAKTIAGREGTRAMEQVRHLVAEMDREEAQLLEQRAQAAQASAESAKGLMVWGSVAGVLFVVIAGVFISRSLTEQVGAAVQHIQSSSSELQSAANQQATGAREQATAMNEITTTINELLATSRQIADSAQRVAQVADQTARAALAGDVTVERGTESVAGIRRQVDVIVSHMLELGKKSQQIGSVLEIVSELAEQTNILAINATIEAAGAGEAGKRFAVVADEIRKLADRVGGSTKEIRTLIEDVRSAVNTTVMTTESGSKAVEAGAKQFSEVASAFKQIKSQVATTTEAAKEIGLSTKQQASAVEQVNLAIANVAQATKETEVSTGQTLRTASELAGLSRNLLQLVQPRGQTPVRLAPHI